MEASQQAYQHRPCFWEPDFHQIIWAITYSVFFITPFLGITALTLTFSFNSNIHSYDNLFKQLIVFTIGLCSCLITTE